MLNNVNMLKILIDVARSHWLASAELNAGQRGYAFDEPSAHGA